MKRIPLVDLKAQYDSIKPDLDKAIRETIETTSFIMGDRVKKFEEEFAGFCGAKHGIATSSGTTALHLALIGCGIKPGDEVILPTHTFIASAEPVCHVGAIPIFVDSDPETYNIDPNLVESAITPRTRAIMPVHLYGQCAEMDAILEIANKHDLKVIEDSAQAHGARYKGRNAGTMGDFGCFSFFPGKNLGAYGDAGMVITNNPEQGETLRLLANHGRRVKYEHELIGYNFRMDALQAAILRVKLKHLNKWTESRRKLAHRYNELLKNLPVKTPVEVYKHVYHLYVIQSENRDALLASLKERKIFPGIHYPIPLHLQSCFKEFPKAQKGAFPVAEKLASRILSLPLYPEMKKQDQDRVAQAIRSFYGK